MATQHPHWLPVIAVPNFITIAEECDCICYDGKSHGPCCCHGSKDSALSKKTVKQISVNETQSVSPLEEFDGIEDILAVSHVTEKILPKKRPPLLRAKTLPAIITPSLSIIQAQLDSTRSPGNKSENNCQIKLSPSHIKAKRSSSSSFLRGKTQEPNSLNLLVLEDDKNSSSKSLSVSPVSPRHHYGAASKQKCESSGTPLTRVGFTKLARLLTSKDKTTENTNTSPQAKKGAITVRKASSIDSLLNVSTQNTELSTSVDTQGNNITSSGVTTGGLVVPNNKHLTFSPSVPAQLENQKKAVVPLSPNMPNKLIKAIPGVRQGSVDLLFEGLALTKAERKKLEKLNKFNIDLQALFVAVEHENIERVQTIFETTDVDINSINGDGFTPLDIALMTNSASMVKLLQSHGGRESTKFPTKECRSRHINALVEEAERYIEELKSCLVSASTNTSFTAPLLKEKERQLTLWQRRYELLKKMRTGFEQIRIPDPPKLVHLEVAGTDSLKIKIEESQTAKIPETSVTKYKVECSDVEDFSSLVTSQEVTDIQRLEVVITNLVHGSTYYVQVAAGNSKGLSSYQKTSPISAVPSSWRDLDNREARGVGQLRKLDDLFHQIINSRPAHAAEVKVSTEPSDTPHQQRRQMKKSIKNLFTSAPNFQKNMKRGVYLACLFYHEDKILVTTEQMIPVLEVDESYPPFLHAHFHWLMKVACTWEDVKTLRQDMEKSHSASTLHFRSKLLQAIEQMQAALGTRDIGQLFYKPFKDTEGTLVITTVRYVSDLKSQKNLSVRWLPLSKIQRTLPSVNTSDYGEAPSVSEQLLSSLQEIITYNEVSCLRLSRGLYLGYVKLKSSVDVIRVLVPWKAPNVLPFCRIRENPHVAKEEWEWLQVLANDEQSGSPTTVQQRFQKLLTSAVKNLCSHYSIPADQIGAHRIYEAEVIELSPDVSFVLMMPPLDSVCSVPGQSDELTSRADCIPLPVQIFEMIHMKTYNSSFIARYSRLSSILEMDTMLAQHAQREAFSSSEITLAKHRLNQLQEFQIQVDNTWRAMRWIMDVLTFARDKQSNCGISLDHILIQDIGPPSPQSSPQQSSVQNLFSYGREECKLSPDTSLKIVSSSSLESTECRYKEIRRSASTSRLLKNNSKPETDMNDSADLYSPKDTSVNLVANTVEVDFKEDCVTITPHPDSSHKETVDENEEKEQNQEWLLDLPDCIVLSNNESLRSSITDSIRSLSSHEADGVQADEEASEKTSVYSKDSACSIGEGTQPCQNNSVSEEETSDSDFFKRPSSSNSNSSNGSNPSTAQPDILRIYIAYESGLPSGTSVKLHVSPHTTAREIVDLVVKQLNMAVILKGRGGPIYAAAQLKNFCLTAVLGTRERCLSDDFQPLSLQNPWTKGKLFVRIKSDITDSSKQ
ncbi:ankyrin repeat and fibronectin type-III domain-containing protein 1-like isoform X2 [Tachypleus tridentatus]|uniref:ankyrin repeat and fibronectin type-III domain-containing protein 1-like isoform X2 n=1 Tax=Tachypleus tridentatus TaxID=6853 RepID=UPI003FD50CEB